MMKRVQISEAFKKDITFMLHELLAVIERFDPKTKEEFVRLRETFKKTRESTIALEHLIDHLETDQMAHLIKAFSLYLMLINIIEERYETSKASLDEGIRSLELEGFDKKDILSTLKNIRFYPVFTAHPTEARRRTFLEAHHEIGGLLDKIFDFNDKEAKRRLRYRLTLLWQSALIRKEKIEVLFELDNLLYIVESSIIPSMIEVEQQIEKFTGKLQNAIIHLGSWIGGDRDGNPYVTNDVMVQAMKTQHSTIIQLYIAKIEKLIRELSINKEEVEVKDELLASIKSEMRHIEQKEIIFFKEEPFRAKLLLMKKKLSNTLLRPHAITEPTFYYHSPQDMIEDIDLMLDSLDPISSMELKKLRALVLSAGFHLLTLDFREHKSKIKNALIEILSHQGAADSSLADMPQSKQFEIISKAIKNTPIDLNRFLEITTQQTSQIIEAFLKIRWAKEKIAKEIIDSFILSMTTDPSDILSVLWFAKNSGLWIPGKEANISITPLFETIQDLQNASTIIETLLHDKEYRKYLEDRGNRQEIMIGYSDSSKDGGIFTSNYHLNKAIKDLVALGKKLGITFLLFHGRGGSVSRGGGPTEAAIMASPFGSVNGFLKITEQGEVISSKYLNPKIARFNLIKTIDALLKKSVYDRFGIVDPCEQNETFDQTLSLISDVSYRTYRKLVYEDPEFLSYFKEATPIEFIEQLNLGSRPAKRKESSSIEDLRAIPWVFAWTQNRSIMPAWYGVGSGLDAAIKKEGIQKLRHIYQECLFFKTTLDNIELILTKVDLHIARLYNQFVHDSSIAQRIFSQIEKEFFLTRKNILAIKEKESLLQKDVVLRQSIWLRKPYITALNIFQIELIKAYKEAKYSAKKERILELIHATIIGIAQGLRNTG